MYRSSLIVPSGRGLYAQLFLMAMHDMGGTRLGVCELQLYIHSIKEVYVSRLRRIGTKMEK